MQLTYTSFKVICNNSDGWYYDKSYFFDLFSRRKDIAGPIFNKIYTVIGKYIEDDGITYYHLLEWPDDEDGGGWQADCFDPISNSVTNIIQ